jgi:calmodulin
VRGVSTAAVVDMDAVLGASVSVGFDEAAALFDEEEARAAFAVFDRDGFIDAGELGSVLRSLGFGSGAEECRRMIDAYDEDRDGRIDFREFVKLMEQ